MRFSVHLQIDHAAEYYISSTEHYIFTYASSAYAMARSNASRSSVEMD